MAKQSTSKGDVSNAARKPPEARTFPPPPKHHPIEAKDFFPGWHASFTNGRHFRDSLEDVECPRDYRPIWRNNEGTFFSCRTNFCNGLSGSSADTKNKLFTKQELPQLLQRCKHIQKKLIGKECPPECRYTEQDPSQRNVGYCK